MASVLPQKRMPSMQNCDLLSLSSVTSEYNYACEVTKYYGDRYDVLTNALSGLGIIVNLLEEVNSNTLYSTKQMEKVETALKEIEDEQFGEIKKALRINIDSGEDIITSGNEISGRLKDDMEQLNTEAQYALESHNKSYDIEYNLSIIKQDLEHRQMGYGSH